MTHASMRRRLLALLPILAVAMIVVASSYAANRVIGRASASGDYAIALASGQATKPGAILIRVLARPNQSVSGNWTMVCSKGFGAGSKSGRFTGRTPITRRLRMPTSRPDDCTVSGTAQLKRSGRVTVLLLKSS
jgi:hypothetical protein